MATRRGDAAAATWTVRGDEARRRDADVPSEKATRIDAAKPIERRSRAQVRRQGLRARLTVELVLRPQRRRRHRRRDGRATPSRDRGHEADRRGRRRGRAGRRRRRGRRGPVPRAGIRRAFEMSRPVHSRCRDRPDRALFCDFRSGRRAADLAEHFPPLLVLVRDFALKPTKDGVEITDGEHRDRVASKKRASSSRGRRENRKKHRRREKVATKRSS